MSTMSAHYDDKQFSKIRLIVGRFTSHFHDFFGKKRVIFVGCFRVVFGDLISLCVKLKQLYSKFWLSIKNDYRILIGVDESELLEKTEDEGEGDI